MRELLICILTLGCTLLGRPAGAQEDRRTPRVPVLLAVGDSFPETAHRFRIVRLAGGSVRDVLLLPPDATPELLAAAMETLRRVWARSGDVNRAGGSVMFRRAPDLPQPRSRRVPPWSSRVLSDLREAPPRHIPGVGHVRAVQIWLAPLPAGTARGQP